MRFTTRKSRDRPLAFSRSRLLTFFDSKSLPAELRVPARELVDSSLVAFAVAVIKQASEAIGTRIRTQRRYSFRIWAVNPVPAFFEVSFGVRFVLRAGSCDGCCVFDAQLDITSRSVYRKGNRTEGKQVPQTMRARVQKVGGFGWVSRYGREVGKGSTAAMCSFATAGRPGLPRDLGVLSRGVTFQLQTCWIMKSFEIYQPFVILNQSVINQLNNSFNH